MRREILCYGDSNTWGSIPRWKDLGVPSERYDRDTRWTGRVAKLLGPDYHIIEEGLGGRTTIYDLPEKAYLNGKPYLLPCLLTHRPLDLVVLMLGSNDLQLAVQPDEAHLGDGIRTLVKIIQDTPSCGRGNTPPPVLLLAPTQISLAKGRTEVYPKFGCEKGRRLSLMFPEVYRQAAGELGCYFLNAADYAGPSEADGLHWMPESHEKLAEAVAGEIWKIFKDRVSGDGQ
ncbi:MAG: SGNH/GDSL hydrolase family protein [Hungatella sp.]|nr:SGNH/GDSL hydrolase family protein [Hungatella sp.]